MSAFDWHDLREGIAELFADAQTIVVERVRSHSRNAAPAKRSPVTREPRDRRASDAAYREAHRDEVLARKKAWWHKNKARVSERRREGAMRP